MRFVVNVKPSETRKPVACIDNQGDLRVRADNGDVVAISADGQSVWESDESGFEAACETAGARLFYPGDRLTIEF